MAVDCACTASAGLTAATSGCRAATTSDFVTANTLWLVTTSAVIVETCHFVTADARINLLNSVGPRLAVVEVPVLSYPDLAATIGKYSDREVDFADASLVWLAERSGLRQILTVDVSDFSTFRLSNGKRFELIDWS